MKVDYKRVGFAAAGAVVGLAIGFLRTRIPGAEGYIANLVVTVFAVLAGFLSVVLNMVLLAKPTVFKSKTAQAKYAQQMRGRLLRHSAIFYCYLLILCFVFCAELVRPFWPGTSRLLEVVYCGLAAAGLLWSFTVPMTLAKLHEEQMILSQDAAKN